MRRTVLASIALCLFATGANSFWQSRQQVSIGGAPSPVAWNGTAGSVGPDITVSGSPALLATCSTCSGTFNTVRSTTSRSSGKYCFDLTVTLRTGDMAVGIVNASYAITGSGYIGSIGDSGAQSQNGNYLANGVSQFTNFNVNTGNVYRTCVDITAGKVWVQENGGQWFNDPSADPATGVNGFNLAVNSVIGPFFIAATMGTSGDAVTMNAAPTSLPSGFLAWQ